MEALIIDLIAPPLDDPLPSPHSSTVRLGCQLHRQPIRVGKVDPTALKVGFDVHGPQPSGGLLLIEVGNGIAVVVHPRLGSSKQSDKVGSAIEKTAMRCGIAGDR